MVAAVAQPDVLKRSFSPLVRLDRGHSLEQQSHHEVLPGGERSHESDPLGACRQVGDVAGDLSGGDAHALTWSSPPDPRVLALGLARWWDCPGPDSDDPTHESGSHLGAAGDYGWDRR